jgi:hypothetical protein
MGLIVFIRLASIKWGKSYLNEMASDYLTFHIPVVVVDNEQKSFLCLASVDNTDCGAVAMHFSAKHNIALIRGKHS